MVAEFQAIVLAAGRTSPLDDLIQTPKPLLQVGGLPLIFYPLQWLKKSGFDHAIVIVSESTRSEIFAVLTPFFENSLGLEFFSIPDDDGSGTAESLRLLHQKKLIRSDMLILGCDLVTDVPLQDVANLFRMHDASLTAVYQKPVINETPVPGAKSKKQQDRDIAAVDVPTSRLIFTTSEADIEEELTIRRYLLIRYPHMKIMTALRDAHIYLLKHWVLDLLVANPKLSSIRSELIPFLLKSQHQTKSSLKQDDLLQEAFPYVTAEEVSAKTQFDDIYNENGLQLLARHMSVWTDHSGDMSHSYFGNSVRCYGFFVDGGLCFRVNTLAAYCEASRQVPRIREGLLSVSDDFKHVHPSVQVEGKGQIGPDSIVGERSVVHDKASIKKSVIGRNCRIGEKARISGSILMDDVEVGESCNIQNCVVASQAQIGDKCELKDCLVGQGIEVGSGMKHTTTSLTVSERAIEISGFV